MASSFPNYKPDPPRERSSRFPLLAVAIIAIVVLLVLLMAILVLLGILILSQNGPGHVSGPIATPAPTPAPAYVATMVPVLTYVPTYVVASTESSNTDASSWDTSPGGWSMAEYYYSDPHSGDAIVSSDGSELSVQSKIANGYVTLYRDAGMTPYDTIQVSVYNDIWAQEEWHMGGIHVGCNDAGEGMITQWWGTSFNHPWGGSGIRSKDWNVVQGSAGMWDLPHGQWYDIKVACDGSYMTVYYRRSGDSNWIQVSREPIGDDWKGGYVGVSGNYHGTYYKDFQIYRTPGT